MRHISIAALSIIIILSTACSADTVQPSGTAANLSQEQPETELAEPPLTDSGLSMLAQDFTYSPRPLADLGPVENSYGFPIGLVGDLRDKMQQEDADICIYYLDQLDDQDFRITNQEFISLLDLTDENVNHVLNGNEAGYVCYRCDTDGDGADELIAFERNGRGNISYIHMLIQGEKGYTFFSSQYIEQARLFTLFQYENEFYYAASCLDTYTGTVNLQMYMLNRNIFKLANHTDSIYFNCVFDISEPYLLYRNETHPDFHPVQDYLEDVKYDVIYANRAKNTFHGDEWAFIRDSEFWEDKWAYQEQRNKSSYWRDLEEGRAINWDNIYMMDINNDGKEEIFTKLSPGYQQPFEHRIIWYDEDFEQSPASVEVWEDEHYSLADMWFKDFNGKVVVFTLYQEIQSGQRYLIDARIQENGETTILMDYMVVLEPAGIRTTEFGVGTDVYRYKPLIYQDPDLNSAFPYNLPEVAEVFLLKAQGHSVMIENNWADIPGEFTEILSGLLADKALDNLDIGLGMDMYQVDKGAFYNQYGAYISHAEGTLYGGNHYIYQITLGSTDYYLLLQYHVSGEIEELRIYRKAGGRLNYVSAYHPAYMGGKVIESSGKLYIVERPYAGLGYPRYLHSIYIHQLAPEGGPDALIKVVPETFQWLKIYGNPTVNEAAVTSYLDEIQTELMNLSYQNEEAYTGDEDPEIDPDKLLRLSSFVSPYEDYYKIDFNNDQKEEYISKEKSNEIIYIGIYQFTDKGIIGLEYDETAGGAWGRPIQLWFKEIDGKVFTFRLFYSEDSYYILNVSLIEGTDITQVQTYIIAPQVKYIIGTEGF